MSVHALTWALDQKVSATGAKFVLVALANYADENGMAYPSQARLAEQTSQSERAVRGHLASLEKQGFITRIRRHSKNGARTSDLYELTYRQNLPQAESATGKKRQNLPAESAREPKEEPKDINNTSPKVPAMMTFAQAEKAGDLKAECFAKVHRLFAEKGWPQIDRELLWEEFAPYWRHDRPRTKRADWPGTFYNRAVSRRTWSAFKLENANGISAETQPERSSERVARATEILRKRDQENLQGVP